MLHKVKRFIDIETVANSDIFTNGEYGWDTIDLYHFEAKPALDSDGQLRIRIRLSRHVQLGGEQLDMTDTVMELIPHGESRQLMDYDFDRAQYKAINQLQQFLDDVVDNFAEFGEVKEA